MSLREEQAKFSRDLAIFILWLYEMGYEVSIGEVQRPAEMQKIYVETGRSMTMNSKHLKKLAADLFVFKNGKLLATKEEMQFAGNHWETMSAVNSWGGNWNKFKDVPHFERRA